MKAILFLLFIVLSTKSIGQDTIILNEFRVGLNDGLYKIDNSLGYISSGNMVGLWEFAVEGKIKKYRFSETGNLESIEEIDESDESSVYYTFNRSQSNYSIKFIKNNILYRFSIYRLSNSCFPVNSFKWFSESEIETCTLLLSYDEQHHIFQFKKNKKIEEVEIALCEYGSQKKIYYYSLNNRGKKRLLIEITKMDYNNFSTEFFGNEKKIRKVMNSVNVLLPHADARKKINK